MTTLHSMNWMKHRFWQILRLTWWLKSRLLSPYS